MPAAVGGDEHTRALMLECRVLIRASQLPGGKFFFSPLLSNNVLNLMVVI